MTTPNNHNQPGPLYDINTLFKPSSNPNNPHPQQQQNPNNNFTSPPLPYPPPPPSASYPPPTGPGPGPYSYPPQQPPSPYHQYHYHPQYHHQMPNYSPEPQMHHPNRPVSYPTPVIQQALHPASGPNPGVRLMAMLSAPPSNLDLPPLQPHISPVQSQSSELVVPSVGADLTVNPAAMVQPGVMRMPSSKLPKGRRLVGDPAVYDIDVRLQGEVQPQLEVTPITKYNSDPQLVVGRQIAVNKTYICYGLKMGNLRVLNINTALRSLLKGHNSRVSDTAFFAEEVHLLASASVNGRFYVWKLSEGPDEEGKPQITGKIVVAIQVEGGDETVHPRVCWHCHKQEVLVVGMGTRILRLDTTKVGRGQEFSADEPLKCPIDKLIDGVQIVGNHEGEVTDLSMCQWMTTRLVSASTDGTIKIWEDRKAVPLLSLRPHDGNPVYSATFLSAPHRPDHIILITGGLLNQEIKFWASGGEEGWLLPSDAESWNCIQTLKLSSSELKPEEAFFNQVLTLSQPGLLLIANAKKNAIYAVHVEYGCNPASTRMDYIAEFTVTMPILSFTGTSDLLSNGEHIVQLYCVQTQAIQQYALNISQFLPPPMDVFGLEKVENVNPFTTVEDLPFSDPSAVKPVETLFSNTDQKPPAQEGSPRSEQGSRQNMNLISTEVATAHEPVAIAGENKVGVVPSIGADPYVSNVALPPLALSPRLSSKLSGFSNHSNNYQPSPALSEHGGEFQVIDYSVDRPLDNIRTDSSDGTQDNDSVNIERKSVQNDPSNVINSPVKNNYQTPHLITPADIVGAASSSDPAYIVECKNDAESNIQDVVLDNDSGHEEVDVKVVGETKLCQNNAHSPSPQEEPHDIVSEQQRKYFCSQASDLGIQMARECRVIPSENNDIEEAKHIAGVSDQIPNVANEVVDSLKDVPDKGIDSYVPVIAQNAAATAVKGKRQTGKTTQASGPYSPSPGVSNSSDPSCEQAVHTDIQSVSQSHSVQDLLIQILAGQKEIPKQTASLVAGPIIKEGKRLEAAIGRTLEKSLKANFDALWARFQEEHVKNQKMMKDHSSQMTNLITNLTNKDGPLMMEKTIKKEMATVVPSLARTLTPVVEKTVSSSVTEAFQRVGDKMGNQLEKSVNAKLEGSVARQIQAQFQTSGKQALQESLKSSLETTVVPAFESSCKVMFEQMDSTLKKGMIEHTTAALQHFDTQHTAVALALRDAMNSASSMTQTLSGELADGQRNIMALAAAGVNSTGVNPLVIQPINGILGGLHDKVEAPLDPTKELSRLVLEHKYEEAFTSALQRSDVTIVSWLCSQVDLQKLLSATPVPLSQGVLLSLLQQLACDINADTSRKLAWMTDVAVAIIPTDPMIAMHVRPIFEQVYQILNHHRTLPTITASEVTSIRLVMHVINSILTACK